MRSLRAHPEQRDKDFAQHWCCSRCAGRDVLSRVGQGAPAPWSSVAWQSKQDTEVVFPFLPTSLRF